MSGHSKWNNIKNRKGAVDGVRASTFNQLSKLIRIAVKQNGSGDPRSNATLRTLLDKARAANMPKEKVQRAIDVGLGKGSNGAINEVIYEGYGPGGVGILVVAQTDNANRTSGEIKFIFSRHNGSLAGPGAAMFLFTKNGQGYQPSMPLEISEEIVMEQLLELRDALLENEDVEDIYLSALIPTDADEEPALV